MEKETEENFCRARKEKQEKTGDTNVRGTMEAHGNYRRERNSRLRHKGAVFAVLYDETRSNLVARLQERLPEYY